MNNDNEELLLEEANALQQIYKKWEGNRDIQLKRSEHNLVSVNASIETLYFVLWGAVLAATINLLTNILHEYLFKFGEIYIFIVILCFLGSLVKILDIVINKWDKIAKTDPLIKDVINSEGRRSTKMEQELQDFENKVNALERRAEALTKAK